MKRIRDYGITIGNGTTGKLNKITDVEGVRVGHYTLKDEKHNTGLTVILPTEDNVYLNRVLSSCYVINGFGKTQGLSQIEEMGYMETPIVLTNTLNVGLMCDAIVEYTIKECEKNNVEAYSINPVVGECNDHRLNNIQERILGYNELKRAITDAKIDFEEGSVGAGTGTVCFGLKGGIGSSSRITKIEDEIFNIGVLVQSNFGGLNDLIIDGKKVGKELKHELNEDESGGSIMIVIATDLPVSERQLKRIIKRSVVGLSRIGSFIGNSSGDVVIGFSTANRIPKTSDKLIRDIKQIDESRMEYIFRMVAEATEEAILNSLVCANETSLNNEKKRLSLRDIYFDKIKN